MSIFGGLQRTAVYVNIAGIVLATVRQDALVTLVALGFLDHSPSAPKQTTNLVLRDTVDTVGVRVVETVNIYLTITSIKSKKIG